MHFRKLLSASIMNDKYIGIRVAASYSVIDDATGKVIDSNSRIDFPISDLDENIVMAFLESVDSYINR